MIDVVDGDDRETNCQAGHSFGVGKVEPCSAPSSSLESLSLRHCRIMASRFRHPSPNQDGEGRGVAGGACDLRVVPIFCGSRRGVDSLGWQRLSDAPPRQSRSVGPSGDGRQDVRISAGVPGSSHGLQQTSTSQGLPVCVHSPSSLVPQPYWIRVRGAFTLLIVAAARACRFLKGEDLFKAHHAWSPPTQQATGTRLPWSARPTPQTHLSLPLQ